MTGRKGIGRDIQPALINPVLILAAPAASLINRPGLPSAPGSPIVLAVLALGAIMITAALVRQRLITVRRARRSRITLAVNPADEMRTDPESVLRFASIVARTGPLVAGRLPLEVRAGSKYLRGLSA